MRLSSGRVSVIVVSRNEGEWLKRTVDSILPTLPEDGEIIVVDQSTDGCADFLGSGRDRVALLCSREPLGVSGARNYGARRATGDVLVFSDAHVCVPANWTGPLLAELDRPGIGAVAPGICPVQPAPARKTGYGAKWRDAGLDVTWLKAQQPEPYRVPLLGGGFLALKAETFRAVEGFDAGMRTWGAEDAELSIRLWMLGFECRVVPSVEIEHLFRTEHPYTVDWEDVIHNKLRLASLHFGPERVEQVRRYYEAFDEFPRSAERLRRSDAHVLRIALDARRQRDDESFFRAFPHDWPITHTHDVPAVQKS